MCDQDYDLWESKIDRESKNINKTFNKVKKLTVEDLRNPSYIGACCDATILLIKGELDLKQNDKKK